MQHSVNTSTCHTPCVRPLAFARRVSQQRTHNRPVQAVRARATDKRDVLTLLLDCDGVLVDTEAQGHRVSFNEAFKQKGKADHAARSRALLLRSAFNLGRRRVQD